MADLLFEIIPAGFERGVVALADSATKAVETILAVNDDRFDATAHRQRLSGGYSVRPIPADEAVSFSLDDGARTTLTAGEIAAVLRRGTVFRNEASAGEAEEPRDA